MANEFEKAGSQGKQTKYRPLFTNRFFKGLWTQRNPLRGSSPFLQEKFYGSTLDELIDGANVELTNRLTLQRRPGMTVYNTQIFPEINEFYSFRQNITNSEVIKVLADTIGNVYDATGPSTKTSIFTKSAGAGQTSFLAVGNNLYMGNGIDSMKWDGTILSSFGTAGPTTAPGDAPLAYLGAPCRYWAPKNSIVPGYAILDSNGNIQLMTGGVNSAQNLTQTLHPEVNQNGWTAHDADYEAGTDQGHSWQSGAADAYGSPESAIDGSTASYCHGQGMHTHAYKGVIYKFKFPGDPSTVTGIKLNVYSSVLGYITGRDAGIWYSKDNDTTYTKVYQTNNRPLQWDAITIPADTDPNDVFVMAFLDAHDDMEQQVYEINLVVNVTLESISLGTTSRVTGSKTPVWNTQVYGNTTDGEAIWLNMGPISQWQSDNSYSTSSDSVSIVDTNGNLQVVQNTGQSGATQPTWATAPGATTTDGTVTWLNVGPGNPVAFKNWQYVYAFHDTTGNVSTASPISTPTGPVLGTIAIPLSGAGSSDPGVDKVWIFRTLDGGATLLYCDEVDNPGGASQDARRAVVFTQNLVFLATTAGVAGNQLTLQLVSVGSADADAISVTGDAIVVDIKKLDASIRTTADITALFGTYGAAHPTTHGGVITVTGGDATPAVVGGPLPFGQGADAVDSPNTWTFTDTHPDDDLNEFIQAPIAHGNDPPPLGLTNLCFHLGRIWGSVGNTVYYSRVADATAGNPLECFPPNNYIVFPSKVTKLHANGMGLLVFTVSDVYVVLWQGTSTSIIQTIPYLQGIGLLSPNAFDVNGSIIYMHTSDGQVISLDPSSGVSEIGFPIGDQIVWSPASSYIASHISGSSDRAVYLADGSTGWYRCNPTSAPETGLSWSPKAVMAYGTAFTITAITGNAGNGTVNVTAANKLVVGQTVVISDTTNFNGSFAVATRTDAGFTYAQVNAHTAETSGKATVVGLKAVQSIEILPGTKRLLIAPKNGGVILQRDLTAFSDNGVLYTANATIGSLVLAHPGQMAEIIFITADSSAVGTRPVLKVRTDEISGAFATLNNYVADPPKLVTSASIYGNRYYFNQAGAPAWCRHMQIDVSWTTEAIRNELLTYTIFGTTWNE